VEQINNGASADYYLARWSHQERERLVIVDVAGNVVSSCSVAQSCDRPGWEMLVSAGWCAYPGSEWEEEPPGRWEVAVFRDKSFSGGSE
jgi:hypothetical protein